MCIAGHNLEIFPSTYIMEVHSNLKTSFVCEVYKVLIIWSYSVCTYMYLKPAKLVTRRKWSLIRCCLIKREMFNYFLNVLRDTTTTASNNGCAQIYEILFNTYYAQCFFSTIFRQFKANNCRNSELEEKFGWVRQKTAELGQDFGPVRLYLQSFCLIRAQLAYFFKVFV